MDAVKAKSPMTVQPTEAPKRMQQVQSETAQIQASQASASQKSAYEQPKPTTNTQGQQLGQRLNAIA
jgi:hypothetical protein